MTIIEVCVETLEDIQIAKSVGADRVEVVRDLHTGGLTPTDDLIEAALDAGFEHGVRVIVRENPDTFHLTADEVDQQANEIARLRRQFPSEQLGFVVGGLTRTQTSNNEGVAVDINLPAAKQWRAAAGEASLVFHRAYDQADDVRSALEALIGAGYDAVLTTGGDETNAQPEVLASLVDQSAGRIDIIGSGRVREDNAAQLTETAGLKEIHFRVPTSPDGSRDREGARKTVEALRALSDTPRSP